MAYLSAVIGVRDSSGVRVDAPDSLGNYLPIVLKLGANLTATATQSGGVSVVTIAAAGGGSVTSVTGSAPIVSSGGATPEISISAASGAAAGSMSAAHYSLVNGATSAATASTVVKRDAAGRFQAVAGVAADDVAVVSQLGGGAPSRIVALDANDIAEWDLNDAAEPWADGVGSLDLTGYGGLGSYAPVVVTGGSIHGDRSVFCDWNSDTGLRSDATTVGEVAAGTVHGWALLTQESGPLIVKDEGNSLRLRTSGSGPAASYELLAQIGDSGEVSVAPQRYRALVHSGAWTHFAMTWSGGTAYVYVNGVKLPTTLSYSSITWGAGRWRLGKCDGLGSLSGFLKKWRVCNVARSAAYIDEVYRRAVGRWP